MVFEEEMARARAPRHPNTLGIGEIVIGPVTLTTFEHFLPGTAGLRELAALVRLYTNDEWNWILRLRLAAREVPAMQLGAGSRLGWTSWVGGRHANAEDVIIRGDSCGI